MQIALGLPLPDLLALETQEVTDKGVYRLPHAIYLFSLPVSDSPQDTSFETTSKRMLLAKPVN